MQILPSSLISQYINSVEIDRETINATFIDMDIGLVQYWQAGELVEKTGKVRILLESATKKISLNPAMANELDKLLEKVKQKLAMMDSKDREKCYTEQKKHLEDLIAYMNNDTNIIGAELENTAENS